MSFATSTMKRVLGGFELKVKAGFMTKTVRWTR